MADRKSGRTKALFYSSILLTASSLVLLVIAANTKAEVPFFLGLILFLVAGALIIVGYTLRTRDIEKRVDDLEPHREQKGLMP